MEIRPVKGGGYVVLVREIPVWPYERQTQKTRFRKDARGERAQRYNMWKAQLSEMVGLAMRSEKLEPLSCRLKMSCSVFVRAKGIVGDLSNYLKAIEDAMNGCLWDDDRQVKRYGNCGMFGIDGLEGFTLDVRPLEETPVAFMKKAIKDGATSAKEMVHVSLPEIGERVRAMYNRESEGSLEAVYCGYDKQSNTVTLRDDEGRDWRVNPGLVMNLR